MAKYIIDIPEDRIGDFVGSTHLLMPYTMAGHEGHHDTELALTPYTEPDREAIENEVWEFARKIISTNENEVSEIWGCATNFGEVMHNTTYQEAKTKYEEWRKQKDEIRVGDEVIVAGTTGVVVRIPKGDEQRIHFISPSGTVYCNNAYADIVKTGRHFPEVAELLKKMGEK